MPAKVFGYYLKAFIAYVMSEAAKEDPVGVSCFISLIRFKAEHDRESIAPLWGEIEPVLKHLAMHQDEYDADRKTFGSFLAEVDEIVGFGFEATFDTTTPEMVPEDVTLREMAYTNRTVPWPVALQVFRHSGFDGLEASSHQGDIFRIFGSPSDTGGAEHPEFGYIADWARYEHLISILQFEFEDDAIASVTFCPPKGSCGVPPEVEKYLSPETLETLKWLHAPLTSDTPEKQDRPGSFLSALERYDRLFRPE